MKKVFLFLITTAFTISMLAGCSAPYTNEFNVAPDKNKTGIMDNYTEENADSSETLNPVGTKNTSLGNFKATDVKGNEVTKDIFSNYDLTLVNVFTTWCSPCIEEIPYLDEVAKELAAKNVNVIGIVLDVNENGKIDKDKMDKLNTIIDSTKAEYTILLPDDVLRNGRLKDIDSVPESFFVDKDGNIVGKTYLGSHNKKEWIEIVEDELSKL